jgi:uncharacterized HAD superfamily protein
MSDKGLRFDEGKIRHDLLPAFAINELSKVLTFGAKKYAPNNWRKGMDWSKIIGPLKRHLNAIERGEDYDPETGLLHAAHVMCNAAFLTEYYKIFPQGDDRPTLMNKNLRIGIDIDDVLADFIGAYCNRNNLERASSWMFDRMFQQRYNDLINNEDFWLTLPNVLKPEDLSFEPAAYITARYSELENVTQRWLFEVNKFPTADVIFTSNKIDACKRLNIDIFIDDRYENFLALNNAGIFCYLFDAPHNQRYDVGHRRINKETIKNILC